MKPIAKFQSSLQVIRIFARAIQQDIINVRSKSRYHLGYFLFLSLHIFLIVNYCWTLAVAVRTSDGSNIFICFGYLSGIVQLTVRYGLMQAMRPMVDILEFMQTIYADNSEPNRTHYKACTKYANVSRFILNAEIGTFILMAIGTVTQSIYEYVQTMDMRPVMDVYFVGMDQADGIDPNIWYLVRIYNLLMVPFTLIVIIPMDALIYLTFVQFLLFSTLIERNINDFEERMQRASSKLDPAIKYELKLIIMLNAQYNEYGFDIPLQYYSRNSSSHLFCHFNRNVRELAKGFYINCLTVYLSGCCILLGGICSLIKVGLWRFFLI